MKSIALLIVVGWMLLPAGGNIAPWHFIKDQRELTGDNWRLVKYPAKNQEYLVEFDVWAARLEVDGKVIRHFNNGQGKRDYRARSRRGGEDNVQFFLWPPDDEPKRFLMVSCRDGGAHGPWRLDILDMSNGFRTVLCTQHPEYINFGVNHIGLEDLDADGIPEVFGYSTLFDCFDFPVHFCHADSPFPLIILAYDPQTQRYRCASQRFPKRTGHHLEQYRKRFLSYYEKEWPGQQIPAKITTTPNDPNASFIALVDWVVNTCYIDGKDAGFAIMDKYADPVLAVFAKHAIKRLLYKDACYQEMMTAKPAEDKAEAAANALANIGPAGVSALISALGDGNADVRRVAAHALGAAPLGARLAVPALVEVFRNQDEDEQVRKSAVASLARMGIEAAEAIPALIQTLQDKHNALRTSAAWALGLIGAETRAMAWGSGLRRAENKAVVPVLIEALRDSDKAVRKAAAEALGTIGRNGWTAIPTLTQTLNDEENDVRVAAAVALIRINPDAKDAVPWTRARRLLRDTSHGRV